MQQDHPSILEFRKLEKLKRNPFDCFDVLNPINLSNGARLS